MSSCVIKITGLFQRIQPHLLILVIVFYSSFAQSESLSQVKASLLKDIKEAQLRLTEKEASIRNEKIALADAIRDEELQLLALREKTAVNRRLVDDNALALTTIQDRLKLWRDQDLFQKRLLIDLAETVALPIELFNQVTQDNLIGLKVFQDHIVNKQTKLQPQWQINQIVLPSGEIVKANTLNLGPINWFLLNELAQGGLLDENFKVTLAFEKAQTKQLVKLFQSNQAQVTLDPTLERALQLKNQSESFYRHLQRGGVWALPIIFFALFSIIIAVAKAWQLWRLPPLMPMLAEHIDVIAKAPFTDEKRNRLKKLQQQLTGAEQKLINITLMTPLQAQRDDLLLAYLVETRHALNARLGAIAITAAIAPLLGLLGTVSGMIETFQMMTLFGAGDPSVVSGGISKALITTELGLIVAIPALILHALLSRSIKNYLTQLDTSAIRLGQLDTCS